jgi:predicted acetyltransferase
MAEIAVRSFEERDREGFNRVRSMAYRDGKSVPPHEDLLSAPDCRGFVGELDGHVAGAFTVLDMTATRGAATLRCAGVCAVGVPPHERRAGVGGTMMTRGLFLLKDQGYQLASLYAYREHYYRKFGYECCGRSFEIECPLDRLPRTRSSLTLRQLKLDEFGAIRPLYKTFAHRYSGMNTREHERFWTNPDAEPPFTIYVAGDPIEAFAVVRLDSAFWNEQKFREIAWTSPAGYDALMELFCGIAINKTSLRWCEPSDSPFIALYVDRGIEVKLDRPVMYRVLDVPGALRALCPAGAGVFSLALRDDLMPENVGPWRVAFGPAGVEVEPTDSEPDVEMDVHQFAQALLGEPSLADLLRLGLARGRSVQGVGAALALLPPSPTSCVESF